MESYRHTQIGWVMLIALAVLVVVEGTVLTVLLLQGLRGWDVLAPALICFVIAAILLLFSTLTVVIRRDEIRIHFGPGVIGKTFLLKNVESHQIVRNKWWFGWGIRKIRGGWLYNVSGLDAVELKMTSGKVYRIGTDEPQRLQEAIGKAMRWAPR